jgi:hypothetical protein
MGNLFSTPLPPTKEWVEYFPTYGIGIEQSSMSLLLEFGLTPDPKYNTVISYIAKDEPYVVYLYHFGDKPVDYHKVEFTSITDLKNNIQKKVRSIPRSNNYIPFYQLFL